MRQNKSYEIYALMPGKYLPGIFLLSQDHRIIDCCESARMLLNQSRIRREYEL